MCHGKGAEHRIDILRSIGKPLCRPHTGFISALSTVDCSQREGGTEVLVHQDKDSAVIWSCVIVSMLIQDLLTCPVFVASVAHGGVLKGECQVYVLTEDLPAVGLSNTKAPVKLMSKYKSKTNT
jgi:hypothetical protein